MRRIVLWISLGVALGLLLVLAVTYSWPYTLRGSEIQQPFPAPDFTLSEAKGGQYRLAENRGRLVLIFFGYASCPDVCPTTLSMLKQVRQRLGKDSDRVQVLFITVDPDRDTPEKIAQYAEGFDPAFIGLSGTEQQLLPVWQNYGVYRKLDKLSPEDSNYPVEHSTQLYLVDTAGNLRLTYAYGTAVDDILQDVRYLLRRRLASGSAR